MSTHGIVKTWREGESERISAPERVLRYLRIAYLLRVQLLVLTLLLALPCIALEAPFVGSLKTCSKIYPR